MGIKSEEGSWMSPVEFAAASGTHSAYVYQLIRDGRLKAQRVEGRWRIAQADAEQYKVTHPLLGQISGRRYGLADVSGSPGSRF
jgi:excisionase family DNA binding protein